MQSDDLFIRKLRRQSPRTPLATVAFEPRRDLLSPGIRNKGVAEWPPRKGGEDKGCPESVTPTRAGISGGLRSSGRSHAMQRSNSDVTLGDLEVSGIGTGKTGTGGDKSVGSPGSGEQGVVLHREYGSLSSLERQSKSRAQNHEDHGALSPSALRFKDPFVLLGLQGGTSEPDYCRAFSLPAGDTPKVKPSKAEASKKSKCQSSLQSCNETAPGGTFVRNFAHYDVQSMLFDLTEAASNRDSIGRKKNITSGASAASQLRSPAIPTPAGATGGSNSPGVTGSNTEDLDCLRESLALDDGDENHNDLLFSCPHFRNEIGGEERIGLGRSRSWNCPSSHLPLNFHCPNDAVSVLEEPRESHVQQQGKASFFIEHADLGAHYYRKYFYMKDHQNFFGTDERLGPVAISFRREEKEGSQYNYRIIFRTTELKTLRGSIQEESVPSAARHATPRGLSPKKLLEYIMPELNLHSIRLASTSPKVKETLLKLDEQGLNFQRKVGIMYCKAGQSTEEDMYNNESADPLFEEFLDLLGERIRLKGFDKYRAQLDTKTDSTGTHSLYTRYQDYEIMFHVSTMLPYTANNTQQLLRKRHIGNDIVTIVFQEPGALPFTPKAIRSHFQHVFIIVRAHYYSGQTCYSVAVTRSKDIPLFGPLFPKGALFPKSSAFRDFLLAKAINAENAAEKSEKFHAMATRTRQEYLKDLADNYVTTTPIDSSSKFPLLSLGGKKKEKLKGTKGAEMHSAGALVWAVEAVRQVEDDITEWVSCLLGIAAESVVLVERRSRCVIFNCSCRDVIGWTIHEKDHALDIFYERGELVTLCVPENQAEDIKEIVQRLEFVTCGCEAKKMTTLRNSVGQLSFGLNEDGFVTDVDCFSYADREGLKVGARVVKICDKPFICLSPQERSDLLRSALKVNITFIPPDQNGKPRRSYSELYLKAIQDTDRKSDSFPGEPWILRRQEEDLDEEKIHNFQAILQEDKGEEMNVYSLKPPNLHLHRASSLTEPQDTYIPPLIRSYSLEKRPNMEDIYENRHIYDNVGLMQDRKKGPVYENVQGLLDATPDLILEVKPKALLAEETDLQKQFSALQAFEEEASVSAHEVCTDLFRSTDIPDRSSLALSLQKVLKETNEATEEEWQSISDLATACRSILEALSKEERRGGDAPMSATESQLASSQEDMKLKDNKGGDSPAHLEEKVCQLESMLKKLQEDLQKEKEDKALLQAEVQSLRQNNQRLQEESQSTVARLIKVTELLCSVNKPC
ncbi:signal-induced proliferation-associated 1-like protein 2 isoform X1 [Erpetoichthys calabaricus]|uniref:signal-induced proliferation-associated 1-like protein 2 isoform X1 n=1 Tax=Erpetoichthys calabaricus TaxID=27687 RepID=UPI002234105D|nr:signal-induced proliferation-associated 1-like protein 2 isoform X1 [Erpetoichthys calabaricus]XP_051789573.1 signal-induced proliferation-associated 1-like protein 2 isoform X1 [Erpetoichthys calabaricus]XP_051789576.1 signal-induced proliferation-associated 1-like protein 2 isoform X1 [Erpetoichthys calabaricus]XP_051789579.1 signal-induced proliferation-associated 1-like protein 2 isoform X1 [Erpetoichthys calabaricus]